MVLKLSRFYYGTAAAAIVLMNVYNIGIDGSTVRHIFRFDFYYVTAVSFLLAAILHVYSHVRLLPVTDLISRAGSAEEEQKTFDLLIRFPREVLCIVLAAGILFSGVYHCLELYWFRVRSFDELVLRHLVVELTFSGALAVVFMAAARAMLRPYVNRLTKVTVLSGSSRSFVTAWTAAFVTILTVTVIPQLWFIRNEMMRNDRPYLTAVLIISLVALLFGAYMMYMLFANFQKEIRGLTEAIFKLGGRHLTHKRVIAVTSRDEIGQLASLFNELQSKSAKVHEDLQNDLRLAADVQRMLLPDEDHECDGVAMKCFHTSAKEVGGDFYDYVKLPDGRVAVVIGEVSGKGLPAGLLMTAAVMLLRMEMKEGGTAGEMITRLNISLMEASNGEVLLNLGLALIGPLTGSVEYASAGQAAPFLIRGGSARQLSATSLPLGASPETVYRGISWDQLPGERMLFCSSGLMEQFRMRPNENGCESFRLLLETIPAHATRDELMTYILAKRKNRVDLHSDQTLLIFEFMKPNEREELLYA